MTSRPKSGWFPEGDVLDCWWQHLRNDFGQPATPVSYREPNSDPGTLPQLASEAIGRWWFAHVLFHHVEALVQVLRPIKPNPLQLSLCKVLASTEGLRADQFPLDRQLLHSLFLHPFGQHGLVEENQDRWRVTPRGREGLRTGEFIGLVPQRRLFSFFHAGLGEAPHFLALDPGTLVGWPVPGSPPAFDPESLVACAHQSTDWKQRHGFPADVVDVLRQVSSEEEWNRVILVRNEIVPVVLVEAAVDGGDSVTAAQSSSVPRVAKMFVVELGDEELNTVGSVVPPELREVLRISQSWEMVFPALQQAPTSQGWQEAWLDWIKTQVWEPEAPQGTEGGHLQLTGNCLRWEQATPEAEEFLASRDHPHWLLAEIPHPEDHFQRYWRAARMTR